MGGGRGERDRGFLVALESAPEDDGGKTPFVIHDSVGYLLAVNARLLQRVMTARLAAKGVMHAHWSIMLALWAGDGITQKELSARVAIEGPTLTRALERMEAEGMVRRKRDRGDARQVMVFLTPRSRELREKLLPIAVEEQERATAALTIVERQLLVMLLRKMLNSQRDGQRDASLSNNN
jgi:DNA-binding MarR family transcriptional regulator